MSWVPPDLTNLCTVHSTVSTCQPSTYIFLALIARIFGQSNDRYPVHDIDTTHFSWGIAIDKQSGGTNRSLRNRHRDRVDRYEPENFSLPDDPPSVQLWPAVYGSRSEYRPFFSTNKDESDESTDSARVYSPRGTAPGITSLSKVYDFLIPEVPEADISDFAALAKSARVDISASGTKRVKEVHRKLPMERFLEPCGDLLFALRENSISK